MITIKLQGGLGNQMFEYAFGRSLSLKTNTPVSFDAIALENGEGITRRHFGLNVFSADVPLITAEQSVTASKNKIGEDFTVPFKDMSSYVTGDVYFDGHFQNENYFIEHAEQIRKDFTLKSPLSDAAQTILQSIQSTDSIAVQVRRGDYVMHPKVNALFHLCTAEYFADGVSYIATGLGNPHIFIVSDDIAWCKNNLKFPFPVTYISELGIPDYEEIILISQAQHAVISNSSFGWWGAWLNQNPNKIIVASEHWLKTETPGTLAIVPSTWLKI